MTVPSVSNNMCPAVKLGWCVNGCQDCALARVAAAHKTAKAKIRRNFIVLLVKCSDGGRVT
jgi:hypothetical protein